MLGARYHNLETTCVMPSLLLSPGISGAERMEKVSRVCAFVRPCRETLGNVASGAELLHLRVTCRSQITTGLHGSEQIVKRKHTGRAEDSFPLRSVYALAFVATVKILSCEEKEEGGRRCL